jgi:hypothetical protein
MRTTEFVYESSELTVLAKLYDGAVRPAMRRGLEPAIGLSLN